MALERIGSRPSWDSYFLQKAEITSIRSACTRRKCGAVIVQGNREIGNGFNGMPPGMRECSDGGCPRGRHYQKKEFFSGQGFLTGWSGERVLCACGNSWPCPEAAEPGSSYDAEPGFCPSTHAEINALLQTSWAERQNGVMYVNTAPCDFCLKIIACSGILRVIWPDGRLDFPFLSCYQR